MDFLDLAEKAFKTCKLFPVRTAPQSYHTYIQSPEWRDRKERYWQTHEKQCAICATRRHIDLHHIRYSERGNEPDEDLVAVCRTHHAQFHFLFGSKRDMRKDWAWFLRFHVKPDIT